MSWASIVCFITYIFTYNSQIDPLTDYLHHVRDPEGFYSSSELFESNVEYILSDEELNSDFMDGLEISIFRW